MNRDRNYYREMREKHIKRKKRIAQLYYGWGYYQVDGKYSKNKIHCSCGLCRAKTNNKGWKAADRRKIDRMEYVEDPYAPLYRPNGDEDIDWLNANVDDVTIDGEPLDGKYFDRLVLSIDF